MLKNNSALRWLERTNHLLMYGLLVLVPLLVIPYTRNLIVDTKTFFIFLITLLVVLRMAVKTLLTKKWEIALSPFTVPLVLFGLAVLLSTFFANKYPVEALLGFGGVYLAFVLTGLLGASLVKGDHSESAVRALGITGAVLSVSMLLQQLGWGPTRLINAVSSFNLPHNALFNLSGSSFVAVQVILLALVGLGVTALARKKLSTDHLVLGVINLAGLAAGIWSALPGQIAAVSLTPFTASWTVMLRSLESLQSALIGHGPASYASMYARFEPLWTNGQDYWQFNFGTATNTPLTLAVTLGLLGLIAWLFLVIKTLSQLKRSNKESKPLLWILIASFIMQILVPTNIVVLALQIPLLVFWVAANQSHFSLLQFKSAALKPSSGPWEFVKRLFVKTKSSWVVIPGALVAILAVLGTGYLLGRAYAAYHYMYRANQALISQNAVQVYENQRQAVQLNPYLDSLRREYAFTNLQVAIALANNIDITDTERDQVVQLIGQAIREGRATTLLDPADVDNWLALAEVYRNLIGAAGEASTWAINSLVSAVQVNPINPLIRLEIGQLMLADGKTEDAIRFFSQAAELKPDLPAAYYQLGLAFQELNQLENTKIAWQRALSLLPADSQDYLTLTDELAALETEIQSAGSDASNTEIENTPNVTEENVQQQESDIVTPAQDASLTPGN